MCVLAAHDSSHPTDRKQKSRKYFHLSWIFDALCIMVSFLLKKLKKYASKSGIFIPLWYTSSPSWIMSHFPHSSREIYLNLPLSRRRQQNPTSYNQHVLQCRKQGWARSLNLDISICSPCTAFTFLLYNKHEREITLFSIKSLLDMMSWCSCYLWKSAQLHTAEKTDLCSIAFNVFSETSLNLMLQAEWQPAAIRLMLGSAPIKLFRGTSQSLGRRIQDVLLPWTPNRIFI